MEPIRYEISFDNAVHHEAEISMTLDGLDDGTVEFRMSRSSPGRYAIHEFGKNVYRFEAFDGRGRPLPVSRPDPYQWDVSGHDGTVTATYTLYADRAGGTYSGIDLTHAHLNIPATFMWVRAQDDRPISVTFRPARPDWKVATQLVPTGDPMTYTAPNLQYFLDSPVELSNFSERSWSVESGGEQYTIRLAVHHDGEESDIDVLAEKSRKVVAAQIDIFGEPPKFDFGTYTFIADYLPHVSGDGMEHRNSTVVASTQSLYEAEFEQLGTISHEFFHAWNTERIRPKSLQPFDFERANMSPHLWFAEGFTSYYTELAMIRAGELDLAGFNEEISDVLNAVVLAPGRSFYSAEEMSMRAPFRDAARAIDRDNFRNTFISYYTWGDAIGLALDLTLRSEFDDISLDDFMRFMWREYGSPEIPYDTADLTRALAEVTGDAAFAEQFFASYVSGKEVADYERLLEFAGLQLRQADRESATLGPVSLVFEGKDAFIDENTVIGSPLYEAGLDNGDEIRRLGRFRIRDQDDWDRALNRHDPGDTVTIRFVQRGVEREAEITFVADPMLEVVSFESADREADERQLAFREAWLGNSFAD
jgi:predicted metalloprotease with PDZ domain